MAFDHAGFQVSDMDKSIQFYTEKLGFRLLFRTEAKDYGEIGAFLEWNGAKLELLQSINKEFHPKKPEKPFCPHICFEAEDMDEIVKMLKENDIHGNCFIFSKLGHSIWTHLCHLSKLSLIQIHVNQQFP